MEERERRGSVTSLLRRCVASYAQSSPIHHPPPEPDCWDEGRRPPRQARFAANTIRLEREADPHRMEDRVIAEEVALKRRNLKETDSGHVKSALNIPAEMPEGEVRNVKDTGKFSPRSAVVWKNPSETFGVKGVVETTSGPEAGDTQTQLKRRPLVMGGCSGAYQRAVRKVRGESPVESVVLLGLPGEEHLTLKQAEPSHRPINTSSFAVAMAATKLKAMGLRKGTVTRKVVSAGGRDDDSGRTSPLLGGRRPERPRVGKKMFEDAYIATWSQPILPADDKDFCITFEKPKKTRVVRIGKFRRKSIGVEAPPASEIEESDKEESEWLEWRRTHDRVQQWLKDNSLAEPDESHVVAMLLETDARKSALYRC